MRKKTKLYIYSITAGCAAGTLLWELTMRILQAAGFAPGLAEILTTGPVGFDISVIALYIRLNPGTIAGGAITYFIVKKL
jgi:hypothetical protein